MPVLTLFLNNKEKMKILKDVCPRCGCALVVHAIDSVWCISNACRYAELHLIGNGTRDIRFEGLNIMMNIVNVKTK